MTFLRFGTLLLLCGCASSPALVESQSFSEDVVVMDVTSRPPDSGLIESWVVIEGEISSGARLKYFLRVMSQTQSLPSVGEHCRFRGAIESIRGLSSQGSFVDPNARVLSVLDCDA